MSSVNIMVASLALGGAERIVCEIVSALQERGQAGKLFVLWDVSPHYEMHSSGSFDVHEFRSGSPREERLPETAARVLASGTNLLFTHLIHVSDLRVLWGAGIRTVPVIHNAPEGWQDPVESYASGHVPFVVAVSDSVARELRERGCTVPVITVRHELQRWFSDDNARENRLRIRKQYGIAPGTFLIGMAGNFKAQKAYPRAARVLAEVRKMRPAKLMILGSWDHDYGYGRVTFDVFRRLVEELGVEEDVLLPGAIDDIDSYYCAFDAYLNTSVYEGLSVALLEAQQWGCPIVAADVGGNAEALVDGAALVRDPTDIAAYVDALLRLQPAERSVAEKPAYPYLVPRIWSLLGAYGAEDVRPRAGVLFVTNNLNMGGTQSSLTNLLVDMPDKSGVTVCVLGAIHRRQFLDELTLARVPVISFDKPANIVDSAERVLKVIHQLHARTLCFWNADACVKLLVSKILAGTSVRVVDVSPGGPLFNELDETHSFQRRIAYREAEYAARLDTFVCKCQVGSSHPRLANWNTKIVVIPNGVRTADRPQVIGSSPEIAMRIGTCGRVAPENRIEFLMESFAIVARRIGDASLTIVGEAQAGHHRYREFLLDQARHLGLKNLHFVGPTHDVNSHLRSFRVFVTAFNGEGCSNAVLESMAAGTPVVAAASDSNRELIRNGVDGFVVSNPQEMAAKIEILLTRPELADSMGRASASTVRQHFSMSKMVNRYRSVLAC